MVEFEGPEKQRILSSLRWTFHPCGENSKLPENKIEENIGSHDLGERNKEKYHTQRGHEFRWFAPRRTFDPRYKNTFFLGLLFLIQLVWTQGHKLQSLWREYFSKKQRYGFRSYSMS